MINSYVKDVVIIKNEKGNITQIADITRCHTENEYSALKGQERKSKKDYEVEQEKLKLQAHIKMLEEKRHKILTFAMTCLFGQDYGLWTLTDEEEVEITEILKGTLDYDTMSDNLKSKYDKLMGEHKDEK